MKTIKELKQGCGCGCVSGYLCYRCKALIEHSEEIVRVIDKIDKMRVWSENDGLKEIKQRIEGK